MRFVVREWEELISNPIVLGERDQRVFQHVNLPAVKDELSITLRLRLHAHGSSWTTIFHKGTEDLVRTPGFWLAGNKSTLHARFTGNWDFNAGIMELGDGLSLNKWYHLTYTLSDPEKRLDIYIDGEWFGYYAIQNVKTQNVIFNNGPLHIGRAFSYNGFNGEISNVRYFNWRLSPEEVKEDYSNKIKKNLVVYGSKVALVHVATNKYLTTKGIIYDLGPNNQQYVVVCNGQEIDLKNDVWSVIGANGTSVSSGNPVSLNTIIGFKHQATGCNLHSHNMGDGKVTLVSKQQQVTLCRDINGDDDWLIRRFNQDDSGYLMNGDIVSLFHISTNKPALYSHTVLLSDRSQEVACHGDGHEENNKWRIELID